MNFTKHAIESLPTPAKKRALHYDDKVAGLGVMVQPTGHRAFFWYKFVRDRPKWKTLGTFPDLSIEQARTRASELNAIAARWKMDGYTTEDPFGAVERFTLGALLEDYATRHLAKHAKNPTRAIESARWMFGRYIPSHWKTRKLGAIRRSDIRELLDAVGAKHGHVTANRLMGLIRTMFNFAIREETFSGENPARVEAFAERSRSRYLKPDEAPRFFEALGNETNADLRDFIWLALLTGARRGNILAMRWEELDLTRGLWLIPDTKNRQPLTLPLMDEAITLLKTRRNLVANEVFVFPSRGASGHVTDFKKAWTRFRERIGMVDLHIHDLRRSAATYSVGAGASLPIVGASLGHKSSASTMVYARVDVAPIRNAIRAGTDAMLAASKNKPAKMLVGGGD